MNTRMQLALTVLVVALLPGLLLGQATDGNIAGAVMDATGAVIPGATIELQNLNTGVTRTAESDASGNYRFSNVLVGTYNITARSEGFNPFSLANVDVAMNRTITANLTLEVGELATQIEVVEASAQIDTTTATVGSAFGTQEALYNPVSALPLGVYNLSLMGAGVASSGGVGLGEGPAVGGQRPRNNSFSVEGVDNNRKDVTGSNVRVPNEAVAEFSSLQNQYSAEFGHSTGGQFNVAVRSGGNEIHGSAYWYLENRKLNAVDETNKRQGIRKNPRYDQNHVGGSIGGPIIKNKLFYYGLFEYNPFGAASAPDAATYTPTAEGYSVLSQIPGLSQTNLDVLRKYATPAPTASDTTTVSGFEVPIGILPISFPNYTNSYNWVASVDYTASGKDQIRFRYLENRQSGIDLNYLPNLPAFSEKRTNRSRMLAVSHFHNFSPTLLNELRANYSYYIDDSLAGDYQFPGLDMFPNVTMEQDLNLQLGPYENNPQSGSINTYQLVDNVTWIKGEHTVKAGVDVRRYIAPSTFIQRSRGDYNYSTMERYLLDIQPDLLAQRNTGGKPYWGNSWNFYGFVQDEWRMRRNLTLTLGVRYEYKGIPADDKLQTLNSVSNTPGVLVFDEPTVQKKNFAPRVGLTYSPGASGNTVFRAGFGMSYDNYFDNLGTLSKPPQLETTVALAPSDEPDFLANGGIRPSAAGEDLTPQEWRMATGTYIMDQHLPVSYQWTFGVERVFAKDYTLNVRYLGTRGSRLFTQSVINLQPGITKDRHLPTYLQRPSQAELDELTLTQDQLFTEAYDIGASYLQQYLDTDFVNWVFAFPNRGNSSYHGLATEFSRRFSNGLLFKAAYTWSKNIDDSTADLYSTLLSPRRPEDFQNLRAERSRSFLDRPHRFSFTWVYDSPWFDNHDNWAMRNLAGNWVISGTYIAESPQWATVQAGRDANLNQDSAGDRAIVNPAGEDKVGTDVIELMNTNGDVVAYIAEDPNARYIRTGYGAYSTGGRQTLPLRGINNWDFGLSKKFNVAESKALEFRAHFYNLFNHAQYTPGKINTVEGIDSTQTRNHLIPGNEMFNDPTRVYSSNPRSIHLVMRFTF